MKTCYKTTFTTAYRVNWCWGFVGGPVVVLLPQCGQVGVT